MIKIWIKLFYKNLLNNKLNVLVNLLGLTLSFTGLLLVSLYFSDENSYNKWIDHSDEIYRVLHFTEDEGIWETSNMIEGETFLNEIPEVVDVYLSESWYSESIVEVNHEKIFTNKILEGDSNFFSFFPFKIQYGSIERFKSGINKAALSLKEAKKLFGTGNVVGKELKIGDGLFEIVTVYKGNSKSFFNPNVVLNLKSNRKPQWGSFSQNLFCRMSKNSDLNGVEQKMYNAFRKHCFIPGAAEEGISVEEYESRYGLFVKLENLEDIRLKSEAYETGPEGKGNYALILIMMGLSILLLIISCVNFINLFLASSYSRAKEIGVKKTLGLSSTKIFFQYFSEIAIQILLAFFFSFILVELILPSFNAFSNKSLTIFDPQIIGQFLVVFICIVGILGSVCGLYLVKFDPKLVLKGNIARSKKGKRIQHIMLGVQFIISGFFLIGVVIIQKQVDFMLEKDLGFNGDQILICELNGVSNRYQKYETLKQEMRNYSGIKAVTSNYQIPGGGNTNSTTVVYKDQHLNMNGNAMDYNYFDVLDIEIVKGRNISNQFSEDTISKILINEMAVKQLGLPDDPIGVFIDVGFNANIKMEIIGVVKDYHLEGFDRKIEPMFFFHWKTFSFMEQNLTAIQFKINAQQMESSIQYIETYWKQNMQEDYPFDYMFLDEHFKTTYQAYNNQKSLFIILTVVVIIISLLGLFALSVLTIQQRLKEVAIRKTLGANTKQIIYPLISGFLTTTIMASVITLPLAYLFAVHWLRQFAYRIDIPWIVFIICPVVLMAIVVSIVGFRSYFVTKIEPVKYLKYE